MEKLNFWSGPAEFLNCLYGPPTRNVAHSCYTYATAKFPKLGSVAQWRGWKYRLKIDSDILLFLSSSAKVLYFFSHYRLRLFLLFLRGKSILSNPSFFSE